jgi:Zn-dependent protease with chaperone function
MPHAYPIDKDEARILPCRHCQARNRVHLQRALTQPDRLRCGSCQAPLLCGPEAALSGLTGCDYQHPLDRESLKALEAVPGVATMLKKMVEVTLERYDRLFNQSSFVRVGQGQLRTLERLFERAGYALGMRELPDLYVFYSPEVNAYTGGVERHYVAVSSTLCDLFSEEEIGAVLCHELAHINSQHVLYKIAARIFSYAAGELTKYALGLPNLVLLPLQLALLKWDRCSELTADRGMLLGMRDPELCLRVLMKLSCASQKMAVELSLPRFMEQAQRARQASDEGVLDRLYTVMQTMARTHPFPLWRAAELWDWTCDGEYLDILHRHS